MTRQACCKASASAQSIQLTRHVKCTDLSTTFRVYYPETGEFENIDFRELSEDRLGLHPANTLIQAPRVCPPKPSTAVSEKVSRLQYALCNCATLPVTLTAHTLPLSCLTLHECCAMFMRPRYTNVVSMCTGDQICLRCCDSVEDAAALFSSALSSIQL